MTYSAWTWVKLFKFKIKFMGYGEAYAQGRIEGYPCLSVYCLCLPTLLQVGIADHHQALDSPVSRALVLMKQKHNIIPLISKMLFIADRSRHMLPEGN